MQRTTQTDCLHDHDDHLKEEDEKEEHEVGAAIILKGFVGWAVPGDKYKHESPTLHNFAQLTSTGTMSE